MNEESELKVTLTPAAAGMPGQKPAVPQMGDPTTAKGKCDQVGCHEKATRSCKIDTLPGQGPVYQDRCERHHGDHKPSEDGCKLEA